MDLTGYPRTPRLVNHFSLGTDPEFTFADDKGNYIHAEVLGLNTLSAFGCDMAGRQAELRAYPSKFALEVVASLVDALRWLVTAHGTKVSNLQWYARAFNGKDGCGGHIHFGTKKRAFKTATYILDDTMRRLLESNVLSKADVADRIRFTKYGSRGDIRPQTHGFEYRSLPTCLENPWLCYFVLVINKLMLHHGDSVGSFLELLRKYEHVDDDAAIALKGIKVLGIPSMKGLDIRLNWGLLHSYGLPQSIYPVEEMFFPSVMKPEEQTCLELFRLFTQGVRLPIREPEATWRPLRLPADVYKVTVQPHTLGHLPDVGMNLLSKKYKVGIQRNPELHAPVLIETPVMLPKSKINERLRKEGFYGSRFAPLIGDSIRIRVNYTVCKSLEQCKKLNKILADSSLFPVCRARKLDETDWSMWEKAPQAIEPMLGKILAKIKGKRVRAGELPKPEIEQVPFALDVDIDEGGF